jgi:hypothetical protein
MISANQQVRIKSQIHVCLDILDEFGLRAAYPTEGFSNKWMKDSQKQASKQPSFKEALKVDTKLASLWNKAELAGFSG